MFCFAIILFLARTKWQLENWKKNSNCSGPAWHRLDRLSTFFCFCSQVAKRIISKNSNLKSNYQLMCEIFQVFSVVPGWQCLRNLHHSFSMIKPARWYVPCHESGTVFNSLCLLMEKPLMMKMWKRHTINCSTKKKAWWLDRLDLRALTCNL